MIENGQDRDSLIEYRLKQAISTIEEVEFLVENGRFTNSVNRIYYRVFYAVTALALLYKFETSKHSQLIGWFNKTFVKDNLIDRKYGLILKEAFENRQKGDYEPFVVFTKQDVDDLYLKMKDFIYAIEQIVIDLNLKKES